MKRVNNPERYLKGIIEPNTKYYIGFGIKDLTDFGKTHPGVKDLIAGIKSSVVLTGKKGILRENTTGKLVRKRPERKISIWKHIEYYNSKWERWISYDREFSIWEKSLLHKFNLELSVAKTPQGEIILVFPMLIMQENDQHYLRAGAAMNLAYTLSNYYLMYNVEFEPIIPVTKFKDRSILPAGCSNKSISEKLETIQNRLQGTPEFESTGNSYRFAVLKEQQPNDVTIGTGGFHEYLMFEYKTKDLLIFENLKSGNATYLFRLSKFDSNKELDKQSASKDPSFIKRIVHENINRWSSQVGTYF
ncbi:hypothetical protein [Gynurincola endophyticus]|uniref:hypothetical protein n=1 Tax=Gynurincola endophyticus TaxID=2479004 RepID=UPI000F8EC76F|nr:hypothetical protein [Gynurincola endophyticus]